MADTASFSAAMKTRFLGPIRDNLAQGRVLLFGGDASNPTGFQGVKRQAEGINFVGNDFRIPLKTKRNAAVGFRSENETLPAPGASGYTYLTEPMRYAYALFNITGQLLKASATNEGAFKQAFKEEMDDTVLSSKLDHNRAAYGDATGSLTPVRTNAAGAATVIDVNSTINFRGGEVIDFVTAGGTVISPAHTVTALSRTSRTITISPGLTGGITAGTHFPVRASSDSTIAVPNNSLNKEINGLENIVDDTSTLHGVNPATYSFWKSYKKTSVGAVSDAVLRDVADTVGFESGHDIDGDDFVFVTTRGIRTRYANTLTSVKQFTDAQATTLRGGFKVLTFDDKPIFTDDQCPIGYIYGLHIPSLFWAEMSDWDWMEEDGKVLKWDTARKDRYLAVLFKYTQFGTTARNRHAKLTGVTDDVK